MEKVELIQLRTRTYLAEPAKPCGRCHYSRLAMDRKHGARQTIKCVLDPDNPVRTQDYATCGAWQNGAG